MSFYRRDDDRILDDQERDLPPRGSLSRDRSHQGQQMAGCTCDDCEETRARLARDLKQAVIERAKRDVAAIKKAAS